MYMHMLGYPTHFGQMETLKLIASAGYPEKVRQESCCAARLPAEAALTLVYCWRLVLCHQGNEHVWPHPLHIPAANPAAAPPAASPQSCVQRVGYLGLMILLDERQEVLMLVTNSLKNDLNSRSPQIVGLALTALGNICSAEMARDLAPEVEKLLLPSASPYVRKKAALCARRVMRKVPDQLEAFVDRAAELLNDRNHAVILAGVTLILDICDQEPATVRVAPQLQAVLRP